MHSTGLNDWLVGLPECYSAGRISGPTAAVRGVAREELGRLMVDACDGARMACGGLEISTSMITSCPCGFFLSVGHWHGSIVAVVTTAHVSRFRLGGVAVC